MPHIPPSPCLVYKVSMSRAPSIPLHFSMLLGPPLLLFILNSFLSALLSLLLLVLISYSSLSLLPICPAFPSLIASQLEIAGSGEKDKSDVP